MKIFKQNSGYSMLEVLTVIVIIIILSTILVANFNSFGKKSAVSTAAQNMASNIRKAQSYTLSGKNTEVGFGDNAGRWGLYFNQTDASYYIFADKNKNNIYETTERYTKIDLPLNVTIAGFLNGGATTTILYIPPDPKILLINSVVGATSSEEIIIKSVYGYEKRVRINSFGLVDVND